CSAERGTGIHSGFAAEAESSRITRRSAASVSDCVLPMSIIRAASVQFNHALGDKSFNMGRVEHFLNEAAGQNVELIVFPEMCLTGYWHVRNLTREEIEELAEPVPAGPSTERLLSLA